MKVNSKKAECFNRKEILKKYCFKNNIQCKEFSSNAFRLNKLGKIIDYYPLSNKCFWHSDHVWGIIENLAGFLKFEYP